jgi:integrase
MARNTVRIHLTPERIRKLAKPVGVQAVYIYDDDPKQLCVRVTPASVKSFVFASKLNKAPLRITIGSVDIWNIGDAREEARRLQRLIDKGIDPRELKREKAAAKVAAKAAAEAANQEIANRQRFTLRALCDEYTNMLEAKGKKSAKQARSIFKCHVFEAHPDIAAMPANEVTADHAATMVRTVIEAGKERASGVLRSYLSAAFNAARKARYDAKLPASFIAFAVKDNAAEPLSTIPVNRGERTLTTEEMKLYMAGVAGNDLSDMALTLAVFSGGQRMAQLLRPKVSDYDNETKTLRLWDGKGKRSTAREHLVPLAPKGAAIVEKLIARTKSIEDSSAKTEGREPRYGNLWLFSSHGKTQLVETTPGKRVAKIYKSMGAEPFNLRDIRRTCETMLAGMGISKDTRSQLLSHGLSGVQAAHYDRYEYINEKRAALVAWEKRLEEITSGKLNANIVPIKRQRKSFAK